MTVLSSYTRRFISPWSLYKLILGSRGFGSEAFRPAQRDYQLSSSSSLDDSSKLNYNCNGVELPQLIPSSRVRAESFDIELVDSNLWPVSFSSAHSLNAVAAMRENALSLDEDVHDENVDGVSVIGNSLDFDEIENMRMQKKLVYKLDRYSKEYEECKIDFHRKKSSKKRLEKENNTKIVKAMKDLEKPSKKLLEKQSNNRIGKGIKKSERSSLKQAPPGDTMTAKVNFKHSISREMVRDAQNEMNYMEDKKVRTPTFNQLTDPYHLPFCLDIFVTKGSVRACVIHRVTSKVVAVAHSISKDMKFDLTYKKDPTACAAVGKILAQRAIEDDIHNIVYTPRKGDKIEGKLQIVLQSIIDHGIDVKVKLKQKKPVKNPVVSSSGNIRN